MFNRDEDLTNESGTPYLGCEEQYAVDKFKETIIRQPHGRYVVQPMFKKDAVPVKNSYFLANIKYRSLMKSFVLTEKTGKYDWPIAVVTDVF